MVKCKLDGGESFILVRKNPTFRLEIKVLISECFSTCGLTNLRCFCLAFLLFSYSQTYSLYLWIFLDKVSF